MAGYTTSMVAPLINSKRSHALLICTREVVAYWSFHSSCLLRRPLTSLRQDRFRRWFQPTCWKNMLVTLNHFPQVGLKIKQCLKAPPSTTSKYKMSLLKFSSRNYFEHPQPLEFWSKCFPTKYPMLFAISKRNRKMTSIWNTSQTACFNEGGSSAFSASSNLLDPVTTWYYNIAATNLGPLILLRLESNAAIKKTWSIN